MTNSNFIDIPGREGGRCELVHPDDIASFDYSPAAMGDGTSLGRESQTAVESAITIRLKNGKRVVCRGADAEALRAKLTDGS